MEKPEQNIRSFHLAGIVPVAGQPLDFNFPWHDCCMPIAPNYLAIEQAVMECAHAGCETIWVICNDDMQPLIRYRLGDYIYDPVTYKAEYDPKANEKKKEVPIFYVPIHPKDRDRRDCLAWSVLHGANSAYHISLRLSKWITPDRYYVSFPYGIFPADRVLRKHRRDISSTKSFFLSHEGKTVRDGEYLSFTFSPEEFIKYRRDLRQSATKKFVNSGDQIPKETLPLEERYSARYFSLDKVFGSAILDDANVVETPWYYNIGSWEGYCEYIASEDKKIIKRPSRTFFGYREFNGIGADNENREQD